MKTNAKPTAAAVKPAAKPAAKKVEKKKDPAYVVTPKFRACFANVFEARAFEDGGTPKFGVTMLFDEGTDLSALEEAVEAAIEKKWGEKRPKNLRSPFRDAGEKSEKYEAFVEGMTFMNATSLYQPGLVDEKRQLIMERSQFYSGCYARASIVAYAYDTAGNRGVAFALNNLQKVADGETLGNQRKPEEDFDAIDDESVEDEQE